MDRLDYAIDELMDELDELDEFTASFRIKQRLPSTRIFPVSSGTVSVTSTARWNWPARCPVKTYQMTLWRNVDWWFDDNKGTRTFTVGTTGTQSWSGLESGDYYLEIYVPSGNPDCVLLGNITVT